jgi:solute:Na+ symporter, SSS family
LTPFTIFLLVIAYLGLLLVVAWYTSRGANNESFFIGNKKSPWYVVAFGMIGASLSGVTFISVPGWAGSIQFSYMQMVLGYLLGYMVIINVLMPVYYRLNLTSIYTYLNERFGFWSYKTGAIFFLLSRTLGASIRLFLVVNVLYITVFKNWHIPFEVTVIILILFVWLYTFKGGIKTIIWTDTIQTVFMLAALVTTVLLISKNLQLDFKGLYNSIADSKYSRIFFFDDWRDKRFFIKQFLSGAFITICMTGLDQDLMQKNLSCKNLKDAQKNMFWYSLTFVPINLLFLSLGALLYIFATTKGIAIPKPDDLYPIIATQGYLGSVVAFIFIIGLISATYPSADSALTSLTTSFTIDILDVKRFSEEKIKRIRTRVHIAFSVVMVLIIMGFRLINSESVISAIFTIAGYTYGPLLGLFAFGLLTKYQIKDSPKVLAIAIICPILVYIVTYYSQRFMGGYQFSYEHLLLNGILIFVGMLFLRKKKP